MARQGLGVVVAVTLVVGGLLSMGAAHANLGAHAGPAACSELITDGSFEAGGQGWSQSSAGGYYNLVSSFNPRSGHLGAYLGGVDNADDRLSQQLTLPAGATSITLSAWWSMTTDEGGGSFDTMAVSLLRPDGTLLAQLALVDNMAPINVWDEITGDLGAYAGGQVVLRLAVRTDGNNPTSFFVDDVSVVACTGGSLPTATPSPTATATSTATLATTATASATTTATTRAATATQTATTLPSRTATPTATTLRSYLPCIIKGGN